MGVGWGELANPNTAALRQGTRSEDTARRGMRPMLGFAGSPEPTGYPMSLFSRGELL